METINNSIKISEDIRNVVIKLGYDILGNGGTFKDVLQAGTEEIENLISLGILTRKVVNGKVSMVEYELDDWVEKYYPVLLSKVSDKRDNGYTWKEELENGNSSIRIKPYVKATYLFKQSKQPKSVIDILRKQNRLQFKVWDKVLDFERTNKSGIYDAQWKTETNCMRNAVIEAAKEKAVYFGHQYDKRGRLYTDGYLLNYQGDEWGKAALSPIIKPQKLTDRGLLAMQIDIANHYGLDKADYIDRIAAFENDVLPDEPKKLILATKAMEAYLEAQNNNYITDYVCAIDATASGMQILAVLANCEETAKMTNLTDISHCYDIYGNACQKILDKTGVKDVSVKDIRDIVKKALMTRGYNSDKQVEVAATELKRMKIYISISELKDILDISKKITSCKDAMNNLLSETFRELDADKQIVRYTMPDGFIVEFPNIDKAMDTCACRYFSLNIKYDKLGWNHQLNWRALSPNLVHSIDAYICREIIKRCNFEVVTIHDSFYCHPNNIDTLRLTYIQLLKEIQQLNMLDYIGKQINSSFSYQPEGTPFEIVESADSYCLC